MRGQSPTDFKSVSLTTRTSCLGATFFRSAFHPPSQIMTESNRKRMDYKQMKKTTNLKNYY